MLNRNLAKKHILYSSLATSNLIRSIYRSVVPELIRRKIFIYFSKKKGRKPLSVINAYFYDNKDNIAKYTKELEYINRTKTTPIFPYNFAEKYWNYSVTIQKDKENGLFFVMYNNKKLYFKRNLSYSEVLDNYKSLLAEQDSMSPHRYMTEEIYNKNPEILMDVGCAEGILALDLIEKLKQVFLFECDEGWIEALNATFKPWKEKVTIISKYASDKVRGDKTCLNAVASNIPGRTIIKLDVEGAEKEVLEGATDLLKRQDVIILCCTYHKKNDAEELSSILKEYGFKTEFTNGYMLFEVYDDVMQPPFFRKGLVRGWKDHG